MSKILYFLRLTDKEGKISLTNILMGVIIVKVALAPALSMTDIALLALGVAKYQTKKIIDRS